MTRFSPLIFVLLSACAVSAREAKKEDPFAKPDGCNTSICEAQHDRCSAPPCVDSCTACHDKCDALSVEYAPACLASCEHVCSAGSTCKNTCDTWLEWCRESVANAVCVDAVNFDPPPEAAPCGGEFAAATCRCESGSCKRALLSINPSCVKCDQERADRCARVACVEERAAVERVRENCTDTAYPDLCMAEHYDITHALDVCVARASDDPTIEECYSGIRACWGSDPFCRGE